MGIAMSDLQREMQTMESLVALYGDEGDKADWQRIRARLTPDRERVARAICSEIHGTSALAGSYLLVADAAIAAMEGKEWAR